jgi:hypothetical protein
MDMVRRLEAAEILPNIDYIPEHQRMYPEHSATVEQFGGGYAFFAGIGSPVNHAIGMGLNGPVTGEEFDRFESFYRDRNCPAEIVLAPYVDPSLRDLVNSRGYKITEFNSVLCQRLSPELCLPQFPAGVAIRKVQPDESRAWAEILVQGFADLGPLPPELFESFAHLKGSTAVIAYLDGNPAGGAGGAVFPQEGIVSLFGAATLPAFRRRGIQAAMTYARLQMAIEAGCDLAVVMTQPGSGSQRNAERQGFRVAYTKLVMVREWEPKP